MKVTVAHRLTVLIMVTIKRRNKCRKDMEVSPAMSIFPNFVSRLGIIKILGGTQSAGISNQRMQRDQSADGREA